MEHELKTWPEYFKDVKSGVKKFEIRSNDRRFKVNDILILNEWKPTGYFPEKPFELQGEFTGRRLRVRVDYVFKSNEDSTLGLMRGYVCMSIQFIDNI